MNAVLRLSKLSRVIGHLGSVALLQGIRNSFGGALRQLLLSCYTPHAKEKR